jgi:hypothetical protein
LAVGDGVGSVGGGGSSLGAECAHRERKKERGGGWASWGKGKEEKMRPNNKRKKSSLTLIWMARFCKEFVFGKNVNRKD